MKIQNFRNGLCCLIDYESGVDDFGFLQHIGEVL